MRKGGGVGGEGLCVREREWCVRERALLLISNCNDMLCCGVLQCVAVCCSVLQCVAVCCSYLLVMTIVIICYK